jgi:chromosome partitioning protein
MPIITFMPPQDDAGATTSAMVLAVTLARNHTVTLIDGDPTGQLATWARKAEMPGRLKVQASRGERHIQDEIQAAAVASRLVIVDLQAAASRLNGFAIGESDLVVIPTGQSEEDIEGALETFHQTELEARMARRDIPARILFVRTDAAVAPPSSTLIKQGVESFSYGLLSSPAYSALHEVGGCLYSLMKKQIADVPKAIGSAELFADEVLKVLGLSPEEGSPQKPFLGRTGSRGRDTVQMSVRMAAGDYERFRSLCDQERRTNGDMMSVLLEHYSQTRG